MRNKNLNICSVKNVETPTRENTHSRTAYFVPRFARVAAGASRSLSAGREGLAHSTNGTHLTSNARLVRSTLVQYSQPSARNARKAENSVCKMYEVRQAQDIPGRTSTLFLTHEFPLLF